MKNTSIGYGNNFGLVGKTVRRYLATTALTATGLMAIASPALADNWTDHVAEEGSISIDTSMPNTTNITQTTDFTKVRGDGDINAGWTVNLAQPSSSSKYVLFDTEADPTMILGALNANGRVYIFDQNGVIFGQGSQVNVGAIVASSGTVEEASLKTDKLEIGNVGNGGNIALNGTINVGQAGLAGFVAPGISNSGVINAKMGTVAMASGEKVTLDLYGDNLVNVAVNGALENALIENKGSIKAEGGNVVITASAAKDAVDNVINMDGIVDVSSVSMKGGKIVLGGGSKGVVKVSGKLKADGRDGGAVKITGQNIQTTQASRISANAVTAGNGGTVDLVAANGLVHGGAIEAKGGALSGNGGSVDTSGKSWVDIYGTVTAAATSGANGTWLIDPSNLEITDAAITNVDGDGSFNSPFAPDGDVSSVLSKTSLEAALDGGSNVFITTVGSPDQLGQDGTITVNSDITKSTSGTSTLTLDAAGGIIHSAGKTLSAAVGSVLNVIYTAVNSITLDGAINTNGGDVALTSTTGSITVSSSGGINSTGGDISLAANGPGNPFIDFFLGPQTNITTDGVLDAVGGDISLSQTGIFSGAADSLRTTGTGTISLNQNQFTVISFPDFLSSLALPELDLPEIPFPFATLGSIQTAIDAVQNTGTGLNTVTVGPGTFNESLTVAEDNFLLKGNNFGVAGYNHTNDATIVDPNSPGFHVTSDNVTIDGFTITGASGADGYGVWGDGADNLTVSNNVISDTSQQGVYVDNGTGAEVIGNKITQAGKQGILIEDAPGSIVTGNLINNTDNDAIGLLRSGKSFVSGNVIGFADFAHTTSAGSQNIYGDGILVSDSDGDATTNTIVRANYTTDTFTTETNRGSGVQVLNSDFVTIGGADDEDANVIVNAIWDAIRIDRAGGSLSNITAQNNTGNNLGRVGLYAGGAVNSSVLDNVFTNTTNYQGIYMAGGGDNLISGNTIDHVSKQGIFIRDGQGKTTVSRNTIDHTGENLINNPDGNTGAGVEVRTSPGTAGNVTGVLVTGNFIGTGGKANSINGNGVEVKDSPYTYVMGNVILNTTANGVFIDPSDYSVVSGNTISDTDENGVYLLDNSFVTVDNNIITRTGENGIKVENGTNNLIQANTISRTGLNGSPLGLTGNGVYVVGSLNADILGNFIGYDDFFGTRVVSTDSIFGDGILLYNGANFAEVKGNTITETVRPLLNFGSGVHVNNSTDAIVGGPLVSDANIIFNTQWDGVRSVDADRIRVENNDIDDVDRTGIYLGGNSGSIVLNNNIDGTGTHFGIHVDQGRFIDIFDNIINNTKQDGVYAWHVDPNSLRIAGNVIGSAGNVIGDNGVEVENTDGANVAENVISYTTQNGIAIIGGTQNDVAANLIHHTRNDGISVRGSTKAFVGNNVIGFLDFAHTVSADENNIFGDGILISKSDGDAAQNTIVSGNFITELDSPGLNRGSGVQVLDSDFVTIGGPLASDGNVITNAHWDAIRIDRAGGRVDNILAQNNTGDNLGRVGLYAGGMAFSSVLNNRFTNTVHYQGIYDDGGEDNVIDGNFINHTSKQGIFVRVGAGKSTVTNNTINDTGNDLIDNPDNNTGDGISVVSTGASPTKNVFIGGNIVGTLEGADNINGHGIVTKDSPYVTIAGNTVNETVQNGIKVGYAIDADITSNRVDLAGWDGIHAEFSDDIFISNNNISRSGDDGIEVHDGYLVEIDGNEVSQSGIGAIIPGEDPEEYGEEFDEFEGGHDGITVRRVKGTGAVEEEPIFNIFALGDVYTPGSVRITNNAVVTDELGSFGGVSISGDDGIEVVDVDGYVYIVGNDVLNSGTDGIVSYGDADSYGADGIHVRNVFANGDFGSVVREDDIGNGEYNIVIAGNDVNNSLDDGIEVIGGEGYDEDDDDGEIIFFKLALLEDEYEGEYTGSTERVLIQNNTVANSGYSDAGEAAFVADGYGQDGIHVRNVYPTGYDDGDIAVGGSEDGFGGYAVEILGNVVSNSGDDGIEVIDSSSTLIDDNTVTNSGFGGDDDEGDGEIIILSASDGFGSDGIFVNNVGFYSADEPDFPPIFGINALEADLPGDGYTPYSVVIRRNNVSNSQDDGIQVNNMMWTDSTAPVLVEINENVSNSGAHGLYISGPNHSNVIVRGNSFAGFDTGAEFESGLIDLTGAGNNFADGRIGLRFAPFNFGGEIPSFANLNLVDDDAPGSDPFVPGTIPANYGGTIGAQTFTGFTDPGDFYVFLAEGAFTNESTPIWMNGLNSRYDGLLPSDTGGILTQDQFDFLEARFQHFPDDLSTDIFFFGFVPAVDDLAVIDQGDIFNRFAAFNGDITGLNVRITGLPTIPGGGTAANLNNITTFAGGPGSAGGATNPANLNQIETAAGSGDGITPDTLNNISTEAGGEQQRCWGNAVATAGGGTAVNVVYNGSFADNLAQAEACGGTF